MLPHTQMLLRIAAGAVLGGMIGYERDRHGRPVGLRTHLIVAMTAATFMVISTQFVFFQHYPPGGVVEVDASRIAASVVSAIGFLAGGSILRTGATVQGLTTAAALWLVTAIGMCTGSGMYVEGAAVTGLGLLALTVLRRFEDKNDLMVRRRVSIVLGAESTQGVSHIVAAVTALGGVLGDLEYEKRLDEKRRVALTFDVRLPSTVSVAELVERLETLPEVRRVHVQQAG